jgi:hypothetical protein
MAMIPFGLALLGFGLMHAIAVHHQLRRKR